MDETDKTNYQFNSYDIKLIEKSLSNHMHHLQLHGDPEGSRYIYKLLEQIKNKK